MREKKEAAMYQHFFKRIFDVVLALIGLPFFCMIFIILAPIIWLTDRGPVFYNAKRLGYKGRTFTMFKFRSMRVNSPDVRNADGSTFNSDSDPRVTRIGRFMRKTSLDETPQLINILCGTMSLVGPRAHLATNYHGYETLTPKEKRRLDVLPGITGYNQAYFRNAATSEQKIENDVYYADNVSFCLDVKILFKTIQSVLVHENIYVDPSNEQNTHIEEKK